MEKLESLVREALALQKAEQLYKIAATNKDYKAWARQLVDRTIKDLREAYRQIDWMHETDKALELEEAEKNIRDDLFKPENLRRNMLGTARSIYRPYRQIKQEMDKMLADGPKFKADAGKLEELRLAFSNVGKYLKINDRFVKKVVDIARKEGVERAVKKQAVYGVIREMFPAKADYERQCYERIECLKKYLKAITETALSCFEGRKMDPFMVFMKKTIIRIATAPYQMIEEKGVKAYADEVYGKSPGRKPRRYENPEKK